MSWQDHRPLLRLASCWRCRNCDDLDDAIVRKTTKGHCIATKRWGSLERACYCTKWNPKDPPDLRHKKNGKPIRNRTSLDYRTENQWWEVGRAVKEDAEGVEMYCTGLGDKTFWYYLIEDTVPVDNEFVDS